jgi:hypothetical protein
VQIWCWTWWIFFEVSLATGTSFSVKLLNFGTAVEGATLKFITPLLFTLSCATALS